MKDEADLEIGCRETRKELTLCIRIEGFARLALNYDFVIDNRVHPLIGERFTAKVDHDRHFSFDFVPLFDEEPLERARVDVLAEAEAELMMNLEERTDDRGSDFAVQERFLASHARMCAIMSSAEPSFCCVSALSVAIPFRFLRSHPLPNRFSVP